MKRYLILLFMPTILLAEDVQGFKPDRYQTLWQHSPFGLPSVVESSSFIRGLTLVGVVRIGEEDYVTLLDKTNKQRITLSKSKPSQGIELLGVEFGGDSARTIVRLKKGSEVGKMTFDKTAIQAATAVRGMPFIQPSTTTESITPLPQLNPVP